MNGKLMWESPWLDHETVRDGAERFVREAFGVEPEIVFGKEVGQVRFWDGAWWYSISAEGGRWRVHRTQELTPRAKAYAKARRLSRPAEDKP